MENTENPQDKVRSTHVVHYTRSTPSGFAFSSLMVTCPRGFTQEAFTKIEALLITQFGEASIMNVTELAQPGSAMDDLSVGARVAQILARMADRLDAAANELDNLVWARQQVRSVATELRAIVGADK